MILYADEFIYSLQIDTLHQIGGRHVAQQTVTAIIRLADSPARPIHIILVDRWQIGTDKSRGNQHVALIRGLLLGIGTKTLQQISSNIFSVLLSVSIFGAAFNLQAPLCFST